MGVSLGIVGGGFHVLCVLTYICTSTFVLSWKEICIPSIYSSEARLIFYIFPLQLTRFHIQNRISIFSYSNSSYLCTWSKSSIAYTHLRCKSITETTTNFNEFAGANENFMYLKFYLMQ